MAAVLISINGSSQISTWEEWVESPLLPTMRSLINVVVLLKGAMSPGGMWTSSCRGMMAERNETCCACTHMSLAFDTRVVA